MHRRDYHHSLHSLSISLMIQELIKASLNVFFLSQGVIDRNSKAKKPAVEFLALTLAWLWTKTRQLTANGYGFRQGLIKLRIKSTNTGQTEISVINPN